MSSLSASEHPVYNANSEYNIEKKNTFLHWLPKNLGVGNELPPPFFKKIKLSGQFINHL